MRVRLCSINKEINKFNLYMIQLGKETLNKLKLSNVVYKVDCSDCEAAYVDTTTRKCGICIETNTAERLLITK